MRGSSAGAAEARQHSRAQGGSRGSLGRMDCRTALTKRILISVRKKPMLFSRSTSMSAWMAVIGTR